MLREDNVANAGGVFSPYDFKLAKLVKFDIDLDELDLLLILLLMEADSQIDRLTVYCLNGANAPRYRGCLSAIFYDKEAIKATGSIGLIS